MHDPDSACQKLGIPVHLHQSGRVADQSCDADETLYRRVADDVPLVVGERPPLAAFTTRKMSQNRARYCHSPEDVLYNIKAPVHFFSWGIVGFLVKNVEVLKLKHPHDTAKEYTLKVIHKPEKCMFPHSEVEVFENGRRLDEIKPPSIKTLIKDEISKLAWVIKSPEHATESKAVS
jgi:hypothetical protein